ncbi:RHS repeat protein [Bacillus sp. F19]|nr:RHS repeat protein [Bacillus sp. F19]
MEQHILCQEENDQPWRVNQDFSYTEEGKPDIFSASIDGTKLFSYDYSYDLQNNKVNTNINNGLFAKETSFKDSNLLDFIKYSNSTLDVTYSYEYDRSGNITKETTPQGITIFTYDANNQLKKEELPDGSTNEYIYDEVGNRQNFLQNRVEVNNFTYNDGNQIATKNGVSYKYDADGNLINDEKFNYEYNALDQLTRVTTLQNEEVAMDMTRKAYVQRK